MKKIILISLFIIVLAGCITVLINIDVTTKQCIDYQCQAIRIPLYLKTLDLFDRHYNYQQLVRNIIKDAKTYRERAMKIFTWTYLNIRKVPEGLPVIDDHVWHIIIRRYGIDDQHQDVFATLCNYARVDAFFHCLSDKNKSATKCFTLVKLENRWTVFDAYEGVYFENEKGQIASIEDLSKGDWRAVSLEDKIIFINYSEYFKRLHSVNFKNWKSCRSAIQSPFRRFIFWGKYRN